MNQRLLLATASALLCMAVVMTVAAQQPGAVIGPLSQIRPPADYVFPNGQSFVYEAEWRLWTAGTARITVEPAGDNERISATADATGVVAVLYPVHDRFQSVVDRRTFCSISIAKHTEEGFRARETLINFNYQRRRAVLDETNLKSGEAKHDEREIPGCVTDVIAGIFYVGAQPLTPDATYNFPINDGGQTVDVRAHVEAREQIKTPAGTFATIRVSPEASSGTLKSRGRIWVWYSDDNRHVPVQMRARMFWGTLTLRLVRTEKK